MTISSIADLEQEDFSRKEVIKELNLFLNDYCSQLLTSDTQLDQCDVALIELCKQLKFVSSRNTWKGGIFDSFTLKTLFKIKDFTKLVSAFELWQFENRASGVDEHFCR